MLFFEWKIHAQSWADETEFNYHYPNPLKNTKFDENKSADKLDQILLQIEQMNSYLTTIHNNLTFTTHHVQKIKDKADEKNLKLILRRRDVNDTQEIADAFVGFKNEPVKGVVVAADSLFNNLRDDVVRYANASGLPTIYQWKEFVDVGGLISFGPDIVEAYGKAGEYVKSILLGKSPSTMPCSKPSGFKVYVNRVTAQQLGISPIPTTLLGRPVQVI